MKIGWWVYSILQIICLSSSAQEELISGTVKGGSEILVSATVQNLNQDKINMSDLGGNYKIAARIGDTIIFSYLSYVSDTIVVNSGMFGERLNIKLKEEVTSLNSVDVNEMAKYQRDSLSRREDYDYIFNNKNNKKLYDNKLSGDGRGVNFSPFGHWSTNEKQKKELKERLERDDKEEFIYFKFSRRVPRLTGLSGDSLIIFLNRYKPGYDYCLHASNLDMLMYINDKFILFKNGKVK